MDESIRAGSGAVDALSKKQTSKSSKPPKLSEAQSARLQRVRAMFGDWLTDTSGYDEATWPDLKKALNLNHSKSHNLFDESAVV